MRRGLSRAPAAAAGRARGGRRRSPWLVVGLPGSTDVAAAPVIGARWSAASLLWSTPRPRCGLRPIATLGRGPHLRSLGMLVPLVDPRAAAAAGVHHVPVHQRRGLDGRRLPRPAACWRWPCCSSPRSRSASSWCGCPRRWTASTTTSTRAPAARCAARARRSRADAAEVARANAGTSVSRRRGRRAAEGEPRAGAAGRAGGAGAAARAGGASCSSWCSATRRHAARPSVDGLARATGCDWLQPVGRAVPGLGVPGRRSPGSTSRSYAVTDETYRAAVLHRGSRVSSSGPSPCARSYLHAERPALRRRTPHRPTRGRGACRRRTTWIRRRGPSRPGRRWCRPRPGRRRRPRPRRRARRPGS